MKKFSALLIVILTTLLIASCQKNEIITGNENIKIELDKRYIQFDLGISTKGIIEDLSLNDNFAVLGYQYRADWESEKLFVEPNVFYASNGNIKLPLDVKYTVTTSGSYYSYDDPQEWSGNKYSFFAYYPTSTKNDYIKPFDGGSTIKLGEPYITYTLPNTTNPTDLIDVMTAATIDTDAGESTTVAFEMRHRLAAIDINISNKSKIELADGSQQNLTLEITGLSVQFTNINTSSLIYLNPAAPTAFVSKSTGSKVFNIINSSLSVDYNKNKTVTQLENESKKSILLIPQNDFLTGVLTISYKKTYKVDNTDVLVTEESNKTYDFSFNKHLSEGRRYSIDVMFTSDAVSVSVESATDWNDVDVNNEFI